MITFALRYENRLQLEDYLSKKNIDCHQNLYASIMLPQGIAENLLSELIKNIKELLPHCLISGVSNAGLFHGGKTLSKKDIYLTFASFTNTQIRAVSLNMSASDNEPLSQTELKKLVQSVTDEETVAYQVYASDQTYCNQNIVDAIHAINEDAEVFGCIASNKGATTKPIIIHNYNIISKGLVIISFSSTTLEVKHYSSNAWIPIGKKFYATISPDHLYISHLDEKNARDLIENHMGAPIENEETSYGWQYPLMKEGNGHYLNYPYYCKNGERGIHLITPLEGDSLLQLGFVNTSDILNETKAIYQNIANTDVDFIFTFSTIGRQTYATNLDEKIAGEFVGNVDILGIYSLGNFSVANNQHYFNQGMIDIVTFTEHTGNIFVLDKDYSKNSNLSNKQSILRHNLIKSSTLDMDGIYSSMKAKIKDKELLVEGLRYTNRESGFPNLRKMREDIKEFGYHDFIYIGLPNYQKYVAFYGSKIVKELTIAFCKFCTIYAHGNKEHFYHINNQTFALALANENEEEKIVQEVHSFEEWIELHPFFVQGKEIYLNCCYGISINEESGLDKAYFALSKALSENKQLEVYRNLSHAMIDSYNNMVIIEKLRYAIKHDGIYPVFQPIYNNKTKRVTKYEALVRMRDTDGNVIPPNLFLENAKESGLYPNITRIMIEKTLVKFRDIKCEVSINLSIIDIRDKKVREFILDAVKNFPEPKRIVFELLETERINDFELINDFIDKLKKIGGKIAIDDFGSGYSNMIYLARIKSDYIKMDGSIIKELLTDEKVVQTVEVINNYSKITNQRVIAEFVSNKEIQKKIEQIGVAFSQGYYIGKPKEELLPPDFKLPQE